MSNDSDLTIPIDTWDHGQALEQALCRTDPIEVIGWAMLAERNAARHLGGYELLPDRVWSGHDRRQAGHLAERVRTLVIQDVQAKLQAVYKAALDEEPPVIPGSYPWDASEKLALDRLVEAIKNLK